MDPVCDEYADAHDKCAVCHWPKGRWGRRLEVHHLVQGAGRKHHPYCIVLICNRCHRCVHDRLPNTPELTKGMILTAKEEEDGAVDTRKLAALVGRRDVRYDREKIPSHFIQERGRRGGDPWP